MRNLIAFTLLLSTACIEDVAKDKVAAKVTEADSTKAETTAPSETELGNKYAVDTKASSIEAMAAKITAKHPIQFHDYTGSIHAKESQVSAVAFEVTMATITSDNPRLTKHLLNEDFFHVDKFPTSTFQSTSVEALPASGEASPTHKIVGTMTIRGQSKTIEFPATIDVSDATKITAKSEFAINRQDFNISYTGRADDLIQDNVVLTISLVANR